MSGEERSRATGLLRWGLLLSAVILFLVKCVGPVPTSPLLWMLWIQDNDSLQESLAFHLMKSVTSRRSDGAGSVILLGEPVLDCPQQLKDAGFEFVGDVDEGDVYRLDRMSFMPLISRNFIITCGPEQVRVHVGLTGL